MPQIINTNMMSLNSQRALNGSQLSMQTSVERLSSGLRINRAKDDAAGLAISERMTSQIRGLNQAIRNANDGISLAQTAEGAMQEMVDALQRMRELAVQAANDTVNTTDRASLNDEFRAMADEITRITDVTEFNEVKVLGTATTLDFQVGFRNTADDRISITTSDLPTHAAVSPVLAAANTVTSKANAQAALGLVDTALNRVNELRADFGAIQNRLESTVRNASNIVENQSAARSRIKDADFAAETANLTRTQILQQAGTAMLAQANAIPQTVLQLLG